MSGGGGTNTVQQADPWVSAQPYLQYGLGQAQNLYEQNPSSYYPGQTYLPMNQFQQEAINSQLGNISQLENISGASQQGLGALLGASDLANNPYAQQYANALSSNLYGNIGTSIGQLQRGFQAQGQDLGLQNMNLIGQQQSAYNTARNQYGTDLSNLAGDLGRNYNAASNQYGFDLGNLAGQQQRAYSSQYGQSADAIQALREQQMRDYDVSANRLYENLTEQALPSIAADAVGAGQTGSSRQGVAEGIALGKFGQSLGDLARSQDETLASNLRNAGIGLNDLSRSQAENLGAFAQQGALSLGNLQTEQAGQLGNAYRQGLQSLGDITRTGQQSIGQNVFGNILGQNQLARQNVGTLGDVATQLGGQANQDLANFYSNQYGQGLDAVGRGLGFSPSVAGLSQMPYQSLAQVGDFLQQQDMLPLQEAMDRYYYNQQAPWNDLNMYNNLITGAGGLGSTTTGTSTQDTSTLGTALGGGMAGYGAATALGASNPYGWAAMAALAALAS